MHIAKITKKDLQLLVKVLGERCISEYVRVSVDGPVLKFSFEDKNQRYAEIRIFDESNGSKMTITSTEAL